MGDIIMAEILEEVTTKTQYPKDPLDKRLLLASIRKYYPDGLELGVERVSKPYRTSFGKVQLTVQLCITDDEVDKVLQYELDDNGQYIIIEDEFGEEKKKVIIGEGNLLMATLFMTVNCDSDEVDEETTFKIYPTSGTYPLFKSALQESGDLPEDMGRVPFATNGKEVKEALEGFTFTGKTAKSNGKFKFDYLDVVK